MSSEAIVSMKPEGGLEWLLWYSYSVPVAYKTGRLATFASMPTSFLSYHSHLRCPSFLVPRLLPLKFFLAAPQTCCRRHADCSTFAPPRAVRPMSHIVHVASTLTRILAFRRTTLTVIGSVDLFSYAPLPHFRLRSTACNNIFHHYAA